MRAVKRSVALQAQAEALKEDADAAFRQGRHRQAEEIYGRCLQLQPEWWQAHSNRCAARLKLSDFQGAISDATQALLSQPDHTRILGRSAASPSGLAVTFLCMLAYMPYRSPVIGLSGLEGLGVRLVFQGEWPACWV